MPQALPDIREKLLHAARIHMCSDPPETFTMRSIAKECGAALGTAYNYFSSKEQLMASVMLADWQICCKDMEQASADADNALAALEDIFLALRRFAMIYEPTWQQYESQPNAISQIHRHHGQLMEQIETPIRETLNRFGCMEDVNLPMILSELLLSFCRREDGFSLLMPTLKKICNQ